DREVRALLGEHRIFESDDAADEVVAVLVDDPRDLLRLVERARRPGAPRERHTRRDEADTAVLVLEVELDGVQPGDGEVLVELPGERGEPHRDVDTSDLGRGARLRGLPARALGLRRRVLAATASHRSRAERDPGREREQDA